jgi:hypothetical protein
MLAAATTTAAPSAYEEETRAGSPCCANSKCGSFDNRCVKKDHTTGPPRCALKLACEEENRYGRIHKRWVVPPVTITMNVGSTAKPARAPA